MTEIKQAELLAELDKMGQPVSTAEQLPYFRGLIYGDYGHGKTTAAGKIAEAIVKQIGGKIGIISTDSNWVVLKDNPEIADITYRWAFDGFKQIKVIAKAKREGVEPYKDLSVLIIDTFSTACNKVLNKIVEDIKFPKDQMHKDLPGRTHWRYLSQLVEQLMEELNESDLNIIFLTHVREPSEDDLEKKKKNIRSNMPEASYSWLAQHVQVIGWLYRDKAGNEVKIQFCPTNTEAAKSQVKTIRQTTYLVEEVPKLIAEWLAP